MTKVDFGSLKTKKVGHEEGAKPIIENKKEKEINTLNQKSRKTSSKIPKIDTNHTTKTLKILSQSIIVKRMCITVLKQYQNQLDSPLAQDAQDLLSFLGYDPEKIIEEIKKAKRK